MNRKSHNKAGHSLDKAELAEAVRLLKSGKCLPGEWKEKLFASQHKAELLWPGKHLKTEIVQASYEIVESYGTNSGAWKNLLVRSDNLPFMQFLHNSSLQELIAENGGIKLIYIDPPFSVGNDFCLPLFSRSQKIDALAYSDKWSDGAYLSMIYQRLELMRQILSPEGSLYVHCDWRIAAHLRLILDEIFGSERFLGDIVWHYTGGGRARRYFSRKHDRILHYAASDKWTFNIDAVRVPYKESSGYAKAGITSASGKRYLPNPLGTPVDDVWSIPMLNPMARERCDYPTQKPLELLERIIQASSNPGDIVADFFCGSGTSIVAAESLGRKWIAADMGKQAVDITRKRLLHREDEKAEPFFILEPGSEAVNSKAGKVSFRAAQSAANNYLIPKGQVFDYFSLLAGSKIIFEKSPLHTASLKGREISYWLERLKIVFEKETMTMRICGFNIQFKQIEDKTVPAAFDCNWWEWISSIALCVPANMHYPALSSNPGRSVQVVWTSVQAANKDDKLWDIPAEAFKLPNGSSEKEILACSAAGNVNLALQITDIFANSNYFILNPVSEAEHF